MAWSFLLQERERSPYKAHIRTCTHARTHTHVRLPSITRQDAAMTNSPCPPEYQTACSVFALLFQTCFYTSTSRRTRYLQITGKKWSRECKILMGDSHQIISVTNMVELLLKSFVSFFFFFFFCILNARLFPKPGRFPKGWMKWCMMSHRTLLRTRLPKNLGHGPAVHDCACAHRPTGQHSWQSEILLRIRSEDGVCNDNVKISVTANNSPAYLSIYL